LAVLHAIHADLVREHVGALGIRDLTLLESALARAQQAWTYGGDDTDLADLAAAYGFGLAKNHGYVDGNKRVAFMAMYVFLAINGLELDVAEPQAVDIVVALAGGRLSEKELAAWVRSNTVPLDHIDD
jgi:death-on-curing protein